jgi:hypothetical protein
MKKNRLAIVLVIMLSSASFWLIQNNRKGTINKAMRDFAVADTSTINKIFLADKEGNQITLERKTNEPWMLNGKYLARPDVVQNLLETIKRLDVKEPVSKSASDNIIKRLAAKAVRCEIFQNNKLAKAYYVGTETPDQLGTYMVMINPETMKAMERPFIIWITGFNGYLTTRYLTNEKEWRDRTVFQYNPADIINVKLEAPYNPENNYELTINGNNNYHLKLSNQNKEIQADTLAVKRFLSYFQQINFESFETFLKPKSIDSLLQSKPINILTVTDKNGVQNKLTFYNRKAPRTGTVDNEGKEVIFDPNRMDAYMHQTNEMVIVQYYVFGKLMPPSDYFAKANGVARK